VKSRSLVFVAIATLAGAAALSCASQQSAATPASTEHTASAAQSQESTAAAAPAEQSAAPQAPAGQPPPAGEPVAIVGPPQVAWKDMNKEQRGKYMFVVVLPRMREVFRSYNGEKYAAIGCPTCHGKEARARKFEMPNPEIMQLPATQEDWGKVMQEKPDMLKFMNQQVKPEMARLLGVPEYNPQSSQPQPDALGCSTCHTSKKQVTQR
jgi:type IV secretory pathway VirB10-like protein